MICNLYHSCLTSYGYFYFLVNALFTGANTVYEVSFMFIKKFLVDSFPFLHRFMMVHQLLCSLLLVG